MEKQMNEINFNDVDLSQYQEVSNKKVDKENELKTFLVEYVGEKEKPKDDEVTVEMIVNTMAKEFPEFVLTVAEENWIRGYQQAMVDVEVGERLVNQELQNNKTDEQS
tara:strand:+ start:1189 stop:1512 length:324 start_codon:yes stop_codon:yes gene_type:complete